VTWSTPYALALDLLALGRVFMFQTTLTSHFSAELVLYRRDAQHAAQSSPSRAVYNPLLGRSLGEILKQVTRLCARREWRAAQQWCSAALQIKTLSAVYRGEINVELAEAVVHYYRAVVWVGDGEFEEAIALLSESAEKLAFAMPDIAAPQWLALARIYMYQSDVINALWALEKSAGLARECRASTAQVLRPLIEAAYWRIAPLYK
jgi:hypothetical protein